MTTEAPTPEEIAAQILTSGHVRPFDSTEVAKTVLIQALRAYGDCRYCEARDAAARLAYDLTGNRDLTAAIRTLKP